MHILKLMILEEKLVGQGYTEAEIAERLEDVRKTVGLAPWLLRKQSKYSLPRVIRFIQIIILKVTQYDWKREN